MYSVQQYNDIEAGLHDERKYISLRWTTPSGNAEEIHAIPKKMLIQFSPGIRNLLQTLPSKGNVAALDFDVVALDRDAMGFVLGQLQWSFTTGAPIDFECRTNNTLERRLQTYKALQVLDIYPFHKRLRKALLNNVYRVAPSAVVVHEICTNHADDWGFTSSLLANMALHLSLGSCRGDVWDCFQACIARDQALGQRYQSALSNVKEQRNRTQKSASPPLAAPKLAPKPSQEPSQIAETEDAERFHKSESDLFEDDE